MAVYSVPHYGKGPTWTLPARRGPNCHRPVSHNPACPIAEIFVPMSNIGGRRRRKGRAGRGERPQVPEGRRGEKQRIRGEERGRNREAARQLRDGHVKNGRKLDDGRAGARRKGPVSQGPGEKRRIRRRLPCEGIRPGGEQQRERGDERHRLKRNGGFVNGVGGNDRRGWRGGKVDADSDSV